MIVDSILSIVLMVSLREKKYLFLLLLLRLLDEAVHDASRDDHGGEDCLGQDDHCLVFHLDLLSWSCLGHNK